MFVFWSSEANQTWPLKATKWILLVALKVREVSWPGGTATVTEADVVGDKSQRKPLLLDN